MLQKQCNTGYLTHHNLESAVSIMNTKSINGEPGAVGVESVTAVNNITGMKKQLFLLRDSLLLLVTYTK